MTSWLNGSGVFPPTSRLSDTVPIRRVDLHATMPLPPDSVDNSFAYRGKKCVPVKLRSLQQERYLKQRSLSSSPGVRFGLGTRKNQASAPREPRHRDNFRSKFAEAELRWRELKQDLQMSPRAETASQSVCYAKGSERLQRGGPVTVQNTNYNFYNYSINFPSSTKESAPNQPFSLSANDSLETCSQSLIQPWSPFVLSRASYRRRRQPDDKAGNRDKLLSMIMEVRANLEGRSHTLRRAPAVFRPEKVTQKPKPDSAYCSNREESLDIGSDCEEHAGVNPTSLHPTEGGSVSQHVRVATKKPGPAIGPRLSMTSTMGKRLFPVGYEAGILLGQSADDKSKPIPIPAMLSSRSRLTRHADKGATSARRSEGKTSNERGRKRLGEKELIRVQQFVPPATRPHAWTFALKRQPRPAVVPKSSLIKY